MSAYWTSENVALYHGDCIEVMAVMPDDSIDAIVCDPPYGLEFMGKEWDSFKPAGSKIRTRVDDRTNGATKATVSVPEQYSAGAPFQRWCQAWATEALRLLKPGGHLLAFGGTRTWHRLACAVEDAGFEIRDSLAWLYGSGFPKSMDVSKAIDKAAGAERTEIIGSKLGRPGMSKDGGNQRNGFDSAFGGESSGVMPTDITAPATDEAKRWQGWGTALKPAFEPIVFARKPFRGTVAANVLAHGTGALNIDGCRIHSADVPDGRTRHGGGVVGAAASFELPDSKGEQPAGRWPANVVLDTDQAAALDRQSGDRPGMSSQNDLTASDGTDGKQTYGAGIGRLSPGRREGRNDNGGASRFFYVAKAPTAERPKHGEIAHPTVKPIDLMQWLVRLVTPPGGTVLDPFAGSGTTGEAAVREGFAVVLIEREADYLPLIRSRFDRPINYVMDFGGGL